MQNSTIEKGQIQYALRVDDMRCLKLEVIRLNGETAELQSTTQNNPKLKREIIHMESKQLHTRAKLRGLEGELNTPINVHRWHKLAGSEGDRYLLVGKIHILQHG